MRRSPYNNRPNKQKKEGFGDKEKRRGSETNKEDGGKEETLGFLLVLIQVLTNKRHTPLTSV